MARVRPDGALRPDGTEQGRGGEECGGNWETIVNHRATAKRDQSDAYSALCTAGRQSMKEMVCDKQQICTGSDCVQVGDWNVQGVDYEATPCLHLSDTHIKVHFSNGLFTKWTLAVFIPLWVVSHAPHIILPDKSEHDCCLCLLLNTFPFHLHLFICLCCPFLPSIFTSSRVMDGEIVPGTLVCNSNAETLVEMVKFHVNYHWPAFFHTGKSSQHLQINQVDHILATE